MKRWMVLYSMPKKAAKPFSSRLNSMPKKRRPRDAGDAVRAAGEIVPVDQHDADDLAEGERDDGEIVAAQAQHREAEDDPPERREEAGERQAEPEAEPEILRDQREGIGADRIEGDVAEVEQAGEADHDVQPPAEHHVGQDEDGEVDDIRGCSRGRTAAAGTAGRRPPRGTGRRAPLPIRLKASDGGPARFTPIATGCGFLKNSRLSRSRPTKTMATADSEQRPSGCG